MIILQLNKKQFNTKFVIMSAPNTPTSTPTINADSRRRSSNQLVRLFSFDSIQSANIPTTTVTHNHAQWEHTLASKEFLLKIAQITVAIICTGLYSEGIRLMDHSITTMMFPNVVFSAFIIITSVIAISYVLGHVMPNVLTRIFNCLAMILYFVAAMITGQYYVVVGQYKAEEDEEKKIQADMLLAETCMAFFNTLLYGVDVFFSIRDTLRNININK